MIGAGAELRVADVIRAHALARPDHVAMRVASYSDLSRERIARSIRPPSMGNAGNRLNPASIRFANNIRSPRFESVGCASAKKLTVCLPE